MRIVDLDERAGAIDDEHVLADLVLNAVADVENSTHYKKINSVKNRDQGHES